MAKLNGRPTGPKRETGMGPAVRRAIDETRRYEGRTRKKVRLTDAVVTARDG